MNTPVALFDLDGTLIEFPVDFWCAEGSRIFSRALMRKVSAPQLRRAFKQFDFFGVAGEENRIALQQLFWRELDRSLAPAARLTHGARNCLRALVTSKVRLAIVTARPEHPRLLLAQLKHLGIAPWIHHVETGYRTCGDPMNKDLQIQRACRQLGSTNAQSFFVGDTPSDVASARRAGVRFTIAVKTGHIEARVLQASRPDLILNDLRGLSASIISRCGGLHD